LAEEQTAPPSPRQQPAVTFGVGFVIGAVIVLALLGATGMLEGCGQRPVAKVGGITITETQLKTELERAAGERVLGGLIQKTLLDEGFKKSRLTVTPQEVDQRYQQTITQMGGPEAAAQKMAQDGTDEAQVRELITQSLQIEKLKEQLGQVQYTEADLRKFFEANKRGFGQPPRVSFQAIVVASPEEAAKCREMALQPGASFPDLSVKYSIDPEIRQRRGEIEADVTGLETNAPDLVKVLDALEPGQVSRPFPWQGGPNFAIAKLVKRTPEVVPKFEEVRDRVAQTFKTSKLPTDQQLLADLQRKVAVRILKPEYQSLQKFFMQPGTGAEPGAAGQPGAAPAGAAPAGAAPEAAGAMRVPAPTPAPAGKAAPPAGAGR